MSKLGTILNNKDIWKKILFTIFILLVFRFGALLTVPGVTLVEQTNTDTISFLNLYDTLGGGGLSRFSLFALGVMPHVTATIIMQLLSADVIPYYNRLRKQGEKGRIKIEKHTRIVTILISIFEAFAITLMADSLGLISINSSEDGYWASITIISIIIIGGAMITIWLADLITMYGVGNGTSLIIVSGIIVLIPSMLMNTGEYLIPNGAHAGETALGVLAFTFYLVFMCAIVAFVAWMHDSERRIPLQQIGQGLNKEKEDKAYVPFKTNPAGIVPIIFSTAILSLPILIVQFLPESLGKEWVVTHFALNDWFGMLLFAIFTFGFTFFYAYITIKPEELAQNFQKQGSYIIGIKPGVETEKYLKGIVNRLSFIGALYLILLTTVPFLLTLVGLPEAIAAGGTSLIIVVNVALDTTQQINARVLSKSYKVNTNIMQTPIGDIVVEEEQDSKDDNISKNKIDDKDDKDDEGWII